MNIFHVILEQSWLECQFCTKQIYYYMIISIYFVILILLKRAQIRHSCLKSCLGSISNTVCPCKFVQFTVNLYNVASIGYICILVLRPADYQILELDQKCWQNFCTRCSKKGNRMKALLVDIMNYVVWNISAMPYVFVSYNISASHTIIHHTHMCFFQAGGLA